jgi:hypothetical protein
MNNASRPRVQIEIIFKTGEQGGRVQVPSGSGYAPYLRTGLTTEDLAVGLLDVPPTLRAGEPSLVTMELCYSPELDYGALPRRAPDSTARGAQGHRNWHLHVGSDLGQASVRVDCIDSHAIATLWTSP